MTNQFGLFGAEIGRCNLYWHSIPIEMQRMYLIFLSNTQNPTKMSSYGNIVCERETSKKVVSIADHTQIYIPFQSDFFFHFHLQIINTAFSYFMTLRNFGG